MPPKLRTNFHLPSLAQWSLYGVLAFCAIVDLPGYFRIGGSSGISWLGAGTFAITGLVWAVFLSRPSMPTQMVKSVLFLVMFEVYASGTMLWSHTGMDGVQLLVVGVAFLGLILVSAREASENVENGIALLRALMWTSTIAVALYLYVVYKEPKLGADIEGVIGPRPFALYSLSAVAASLALWRGQRQRLASDALIPLFWAAMITFTVGLSMSRTALVCCMILFPLSILLRLNYRSVMLSLGALIAGGAGFAAAVVSYQPLYDRFFAYDASMKVGGVAVNASGRTKIWEVLYHSIGDDWLFGKGMASSEIIVRTTFNGLIGQPHNDYLRYYYDTGAVGLSIYLCFALSFMLKTVGNLRRSIRNQTPDYPLHVAALLAFSAVSWSMLTDNSVCYSFVMLPLAIVMGCSLGAGQTAAVSVPSDDVGPIYFEPSAQPLGRDVRIVS